MMASDWPHQPLSELTEEGSPITYGVVKPGGEGSVRFVRGGDISGGRVLVHQLRTISELVSVQYRRTLLRGGELLVSLVGNPGQVALAPTTLSGANIARQVALVRLNGSVDSCFVKYFLLSPEGQQTLGSHSIGSVQQVINLRDLKTVKVPVPPLSTQRRIASILGSLDDKIELNRRMNRTLERMAQALFKSWFIDFDPVKAKAAGDPTAGGLPAPLAALFPDRLEDSELGPIPKGWEVTTIGDEFRLTMGQSPPGETYNESRQGEPFFQGRRDFGFRYPTNRVYCTAPTRFASKDDTLMSVRAPVGDINMAFDRCAVGRGVAAVRHKTGSRSYTYYAFQSLQRRFEVYNGEGTVFGSISQKDLKAMPWCAPNERVVKTFHELVNPIDHRIEIGETQNHRLSGLRDTLLPKLLSGEIEVPEAESMVEEVKA